MCVVCYCLLFVETLSKYTLIVMLSCDYGFDDYVERTRSVYHFKKGLLVDKLLIFKRKRKRHLSNNVIEITTPFLIAPLSIHALGAN